MRGDLFDDRDDDLRRIATAAHVEPIAEPKRRPALPVAWRALAWAVASVVVLGFVLGPIALGMGHRARLAVAERPELGGAGAAEAAIVLGRVGMALHLTLAITVLPWVLFVLPLVGGD
jgi:hypothetical protein